MKSYTVYLKGENVNCKGIYYMNSNSLKMLKGSIIRQKVSPNYKYNEKRIGQLKKYCSGDSSSLVLKEDVEFRSPTAAAKFSLGYEVNGPAYWRTADGIRIKDLGKNRKELNI